jgi:hypothetical protein
VGNIAINIAEIEKDCEYYTALHASTTQLSTIQPWAGMDTYRNENVDNLVDYDSIYKKQNP